MVLYADQHTQISTYTTSCDNAIILFQLLSQRYKHFWACIICTLDYWQLVNQASTRHRFPGLAEPWQIWPQKLKTQQSTVSYFALPLVSSLPPMSACWGYSHSFTYHTPAIPAVFAVTSQAEVCHSSIANAPLALPSPLQNHYQLAAWTGSGNCLCYFS